MFRHSFFTNIRLFICFYACEHLLLYLMNFDKEHTPKPKDTTNRLHKVTFLLNEKELDLMRRYLDKYNIENRSGWCRETLLKHIISNMIYDYPTLFDENEMRR